MPGLCHVECRDYTYGVALATDKGTGLGRDDLSLISMFFTLYIVVKGVDENLDCSLKQNVLK